MAPRFWLGVIDVRAAGGGGAAGSRAAPLAAAHPDRVAVEVIAADGQYGVLFSTWSAPQPGGAATLSCCIGFANGARACRVWADRGFPLVDACIELHGGRLTVRSPCFGPSLAMEYDPQVIEIDGLRLLESDDPSPALVTTYRQDEQAPDEARPATYVRRRALEFTPRRRRVVRHDPPGTVSLTLKAPPARYPALDPLQQGVHPLEQLWTGEIDLPRRGAAPSPPRPPARVGRADAFGDAAFRFEHVELMGFRIELDDGAADRLEELVAPLNFHVPQDASGGAVASRAPASLPPDFRYRAATRTLVVEVLRYGRMKQIRPLPPLGARDYQSQHELLVRLLVGRVDDDTAQAHSPAVYVPAIFVDNPWSKLVGRDLQGFDKAMARFCVVRDGKSLGLTPDGLLPGAAHRRRPVRLPDLDEIRLSKRTGGDPGAGPLLVELDCPSPPSEDALHRFDLGIALTSSSLSITRWRRDDFDSPEFRRSFARSAAGASPLSFHSLQVSPVGSQRLGKAWINGTFDIDDGVRVGLPERTAHLAIHDAPGAPRWWRVVYRLLAADRRWADRAAGGAVSLTFPFGSWYRMKCSMDFTVEDFMD